ncbi:MAG: class I SAM-dependent methyltransferase [Alphaproteobacteria bacterium]|nr:class I SAM-dependent methyltransferase [Alphaproteobacteria bacterium]
MQKSSAPDLNVFKNYSYRVVKDDDSAASAVIRFVKKESLVLDLGAGSGAITKHLVGHNKCDVVAVEVNPASVKKLEKFCKCVHSVDINSADLPKLLGDEPKFDHVLATDVLEHLYDPWLVLKSMKAMLNDTGSIILSLPHAGHSTVVMNFFDGDIEYREWGLMDKTHIRFFGLHNIQQLYASAGLAIVRVHYVLRKPEDTEFASRWKRLPENVRETLGNRPIANIWQVVTEAVPVERAEQPLQMADQLPDIGYAPKRRLFGLLGPKAV